MESNDFKTMFNEIAKENGFEKAYEGWFKEFPEIIQVLELQKSNYGNHYYLNMKIYIKGLFGNHYIKSKKLVKTDSGDIFLRHPNNYSNILDLEDPMENSKRKEGLEKLFNNFIKVFSKMTSTKEEIKNNKDELFILPAVKKELSF